MQTPPPPCYVPATNLSTAPSPHRGDRRSPVLWRARFLPPVPGRELEGGSVFPHHRPLVVHPQQLDHLAHVRLVLDLVRRPPILTDRVAHDPSLLHQFGPDTL